MFCIFCVLIFSCVQNLKPYNDEKEDSAYDTYESKGTNSTYDGYESEGTNSASDTTIKPISESLGWETI